MTGKTEKFLLDNQKELFTSLSSRSGFFLMKLKSRRGKYSSVLFYVFTGNKENPSFFLKLNRSPYYFKVIENEYENLKYIHEKAGKCKLGVPKILFCTKYEENVILCENFLKGEPQLSKINRLNANGSFDWKDTRFYLEKSANWLLKFQECTKNKDIVLDDLWLKENITDNLDKLIKQNSSFDIFTIDLLKKISDILIKFKGVKIPISASHGDFDQWNILIDRGNINVIDWEECEKSAPVYNDFFTLIFHFALLHNFKYTEEENFKSFFACDSEGYNIFLYTLSLFSKRYNLPQELFYALAPFYAVKALTKEYPEQREPKSMPLNSLNNLKLITHFSWEKIR